MNDYLRERVRKRALELSLKYESELPGEDYEVRIAEVPKHSTLVRIEFAPIGHESMCPADEGWVRIVNELHSEFENDRHVGGIELLITASWASGIGDEFEDADDWGTQFLVRRTNNG